MPWLKRAAPRMSRQATNTNRIQPGKHLDFITKSSAFSQFEDPTEEVQRLRERVELRRARQRSPWLLERAIDTVGKLARGPGVAKSVANGEANWAIQLANWKLTTAALPLSCILQAQAEMRISKPQVRESFDGISRPSRI